MIARSEAYQKLKNQIQDSLDFVILCCHGVPALKGYIKAVEGGSAPKIPDPDLFGSPVDHQRLREIMPSYRKVLGRLLILSSFSYFEAYVSDVLEEVFEFHGGAEQFLQLAIERRNKGFALADDPEIKKRVKRLREKPKKGKQEKYAKLNIELNHTGYGFPTDILSAYGIVHLQEYLGRLQASQIPGIIHSALGLKMADSDIKTFHRIRKLRNEIAHGRVSEVDLSAAIQDNRFLRELAVKIDSHIVRYFFIVEL